MTVLPFVDPREHSERTATQQAESVAVRGSYRAPTGRVGRFRGSFRLERLVTEYEHPAVAGVFAGVLCDADGRQIAIASRRHTAAVEVVPLPRTSVLHLGPVDVNVHGFMVTMAETTIELANERLPSAWSAHEHAVTDPSAGAGPLPSVTEILDRVRLRTTGRGR
jgi:hypothetical protein